MARKTFATSFSLAADIKEKVQQIPHGMRSELINDFFRSLDLKVEEKVVTQRVMVNGKDMGQAQPVKRGRGRPRKTETVAATAVASRAAKTILRKGGARKRNYAQLVKAMRQQEKKIQKLEAAQTAH